MSRSSYVTLSEYWSRVASRSRRWMGVEYAASSCSSSECRLRSASVLTGISRAYTRNQNPPMITMPHRLPRRMKPATVSTTPASKGRQRGRTPRARRIRPTAVSSALIRTKRRIRLAGVCPGAPYRPAGPADGLHTRFRRCARSLIAASCTRLRAACLQWYAFALLRSAPARQDRAPRRGRYRGHPRSLWAYARGFLRACPAGLSGGPASAHRRRPLGGSSNSPGGPPFVGRQQLAVGVDRRCVLHLLLVIGDLEVSRAHGRLVKVHEHEPVPAHHPDLDRAEGRQVGAGVHVDGLQLADLVAVGVDHILATPVPDILRLEHAAPPLQQRHAAVCLRCYPDTHRRPLAVKVLGPAGGPVRVRGTSCLGAGGRTGTPSYGP